MDRRTERSIIIKSMPPEFTLASLVKSAEDEDKTPQLVTRRPMPSSSENSEDDVEINHVAAAYLKQLISAVLTALNGQWIRRKNWDNELGAIRGLCGCLSRLVERMEEDSDVKCTPVEYRIKSERVPHQATQIPTILCTICIVSCSRWMISKNCSLMTSSCSQAWLNQTSADPL